MQRLSVTAPHTRWEDACARGREHLRRAQRDDGGWVDFELPVGRSDQWVTGIVGTHLAWAGDSAAARKAAGWLLAQPGGGRWGYNQGCEPDADSTAWAALCLAAAAPEQAAQVDWPWLWQHRREGGFSTYLGDDGWGDSHGCVTPVVWLALPPPLRREAAAGCREHLLHTRRADGSWPGYWWSSAFYPTLWAHRGLSAMDAAPPAPPGGWCAVPSLSTLHSAAELAWMLDLAVLGGEPTLHCEALAAALLALQRADGGWPPSRVLRVTPHWQRGAAARDGALYADEAGLLGTAAAVLALHNLAGGLRQRAWA